MASRKKSIKSLRSAQGRLIDKQEDILKELLTFYESLYSENQQCCEKDCCNFIRTLSLPSINKSKFFECEKPITDNECQQAILQLANNKSPDLDGFSIEFYKTFWTEINPLNPTFPHLKALRPEIPSQKFSKKIIFFIFSFWDYEYPAALKPTSKSV